MENKKQLYLLLAENHGVYLPYSVLEKAYTMLKELAKTEDYFNAINVVEDCYKKLTKYNDPNKGAYVMSNKHREYVKGLGKKIVATNKEGEKFVYKSIYEASVQILGNNSGAGNISQAVNGKKNTAYGFKWEKA